MTFTWKSIKQSSLFQGPIKLFTFKLAIFLHQSTKYEAIMTHSRIVLLHLHFRTADTRKNRLEKCTVLKNTAPLWLSLQMAPLTCLATDQSAGWLFRLDRHSRPSSTSENDVLFGMNPHHTHAEVSASHRSRSMSVWLILDSIYI